MEFSEQHLKYQSLPKRIFSKWYILEALDTAPLEKLIEEPMSEDDLSTIMVDDFGQSTVDQSEILYEFQTAQNAEEVNRILSEIISDYGFNQLAQSKTEWPYFGN